MTIDSTTTIDTFPPISLNEFGPLISREMEYDELLSKLKNFFITQRGFPIYICGVPGTGKTATVKRVIKYLRNNDQMKDFDYCELNGMKVGEAKRIYPKLYMELFGTSENIGAQPAIKKLTRRFKYAEKPCIVILDELDLILKRKQSVLYHFFEWCTWEESKLSIIAIANTLDLPERFLANRIASRLGLNRIVFKPYTHNQLELILRQKIQLSSKYGIKVTDDAIEFCARKVSSVSGDVRRALSLCNRIIDWIKAKNLGSSLTLPLAVQAFQAIISSNSGTILSKMSLINKFLLLSVYLLQKSGEFRHFEKEKIIETTLQMLRINGMKMPSFNMIMNALDEMISSRYIEKNKTFFNLGLLSEEELKNSIGQDEMFKRHFKC